MTRLKSWVRSPRSCTRDKTLRGLGERALPGAWFPERQKPQCRDRVWLAGTRVCLAASRKIKKQGNKCEARAGLASGDWQTRLCSCGAGTPQLHPGPRNLLPRLLPRVAKFMESRVVVGSAWGEGNRGDIEWAGAGFQFKTVKFWIRWCCWLTTLRISPMPLQ